MTIRTYKKDYPRPQFVREHWTNLNGKWDFRFDDADVGETSKWYEGLNGDRKIVVPFTYETKASGIGETTFHPCVWYERSFRLPEAQRGKRVVLRFEGVDHEAKVWVNGNYIGRHEGAYAAFAFDITRFVKADGDNRVVIRALDSNSTAQPRGKQRWVADNFGCWYVQTTGIWKTVWLEYPDAISIGSVKITPDLDARSVRFDYAIDGAARQDGDEPIAFQAKISCDGESVAEVSARVTRQHGTLETGLLSEAAGEWKLKVWHPRHPHLYDVEFTLLRGGEVVDRVSSYFGLRKISIQGNRILLNNAPFYQRLLLDQGYWTDSHLTPPNEEALIEDIEKTKALGFNGVRKHQKIEDARFLYWCDRMGLLVWSEMAAAYEFNDDAVETFTREWMEIVGQQYNHPCIVTWVPFNESWGIGQIFTDRKQQQFTEAIYHLTKSMDQTRPVVVNDGWEHTVSDIITLHDYVEKGSEFAERYRDQEGVLGNAFAFNGSKYAFAQGYAYRGQPVIVSEFGGIAFRTEAGWGYGNQVETEEQFLERYRSITQAIVDTDYVCGFCYTQTTDVQQEVNGLLTEDRKPKIDPEKIKPITRLNR